MKVKKGDLIPTRLAWEVMHPDPNDVSPVDKTGLVSCMLVAVTAGGKTYPIQVGGWYVSMCFEEEDLSLEHL